GFDNVDIRFQVFSRHNGKVYGLDTATNMIKTESSQKTKLWSVDEGSSMKPQTPILLGEGKVLELIDLETLYLGYLSGATTIHNDIAAVQPQEIENISTRVVAAAQGRPVLALGARHWFPEEDSTFGAAAAKGGAYGASTQAAAKNFLNSTPFGTIPHALENMFAWLFGKANAVWTTALAFNHFFPELETIALVDYNNREIDDAVTTCKVFDKYGKKLAGIRIDTSSSHHMQGVDPSSPPPRGISPKYWNNKGVSISGVMQVRQALDEADCHHVKIYLTSGFSNPEKVLAFSEAATVLATTQAIQSSSPARRGKDPSRFFEFVDGFGAGMMPARIIPYTMDIVGVGMSSTTDQQKLYTHVANLLHLETGTELGTIPPFASTTLTPHKIPLQDSKPYLSHVSKAGRGLWWNPDLKPVSR
ncbi:MAG: hypothetical protein OXT67_05695, partial [Zetaproteobacteria bacterium]|nr:hypothetical protein [Zetaproteobacteria bacterium]